MARGIKLDAINVNVTLVRDDPAVAAYVCEIETRRRHRSPNSASA
jgi:hypothetical protein